MSQLVLLSAVIVLNVLGHVLLKAGMNRIGGISPFQLLTDFTRVFSTPYIILGLLSYVLSVAMYLVVLSRAHLSYAYPLLTGLAYALIIIISWQVFREPFTTIKWIGIFLILLGVVLVGK
ncbi:MAG: hypothetical protein AMJ90_02315 [candidate division Zixibacteria bacterium SM23_73_2]|nr:MAG: hypothetical protein AMJ90_02315 [candidate division Zixibacteria bacterium SM23_73_2]